MTQPGSAIKFNQFIREGCECLTFPPSPSFHYPDSVLDILCLLTGFYLVHHADTDFVALGSYNNAWNVIRSQFDDLLLQHAEECGAKVFTRTKVDAIQFTPDRNNPLSDGGMEDNAAMVGESRPRLRLRSYTTWDSSGARNIPAHKCTRSISATHVPTVELEPVGRPIRAQYTTAEGKRGEIAFDYVIDASGRSGVLSTK